MIGLILGLEVKEFALGFEVNDVSFPSETKYTLIM